MFSVLVNCITVVFGLFGVKYLIVVYSKCAYLYFSENVVSIFRKRSWSITSFGLLFDVKFIYILMAIRNFRSTVD